MKSLYVINCLIITLLLQQTAFCQQASSFRVIPLGIRGGLDERNLSAYLVAPISSDNYLCLDAGTLYSGVEKAISNHLFDNNDATSVIRQHIKAYCISHPHLDHVSGLIINSPADTSKNIYGTKFCLSRIEQHYFSWQTWANFGDVGEQPVLQKYHYKTLEENNEEEIAGTNLSVTAFPLSHASPYQSTAFLVRHDSSYVLYFGDTGADSIEHSTQLQQVWKSIAPLLKRQQIKGIFIEVSYPDEQPDKQLFGHLTPRLLMQELSRLASLAGNKSLNNLPIIVTHMKPEGNNEAKIRQQSKEKNNLRLNFLFPEQGKLIIL